MFNSEPLGKILIIVGAFILLTGILLVIWSKMPFPGKLPGDIFIQKGNFQFFFPLVTCLILSVVLTIIINLIIRWFGK